MKRLLNRWDQGLSFEVWVFVAAEAAPTVCPFLTFHLPRRSREKFLTSFGVDFSISQSGGIDMVNLILYYVGEVDYTESAEEYSLSRGMDSAFLIAKCTQ